MTWNSDNWQEQLETAQRFDSLRRQQEQLEETKNQTEAIRDLERAQYQASLRADRESRKREIAEIRVKAEANDPTALDRLFTLLQESGETAEALFWAAKAAKLGNIRAINLLLRDHLKNKNFEPIEDLVKLAKKTDVYRETSYAIMLGGVHKYMIGELAASESLFRKVLERKDLTYTPIEFMKWITAAQGDEKEAEQFEELLKKRSGADDSYVFDWFQAQLALYAVTKERIAKNKATAADFYMSAIEIVGLGSEGDWSLYEEYMGKSASMGNAVAAKRLARYYYVNEKLKESLSVSQKFSNRDQDWALAWVSTANTYIFSTLIPQHKFDEVAQYVAHAKKLDVENQTTNAIGNGAIALYFLGKTEEAISEFKLALDRKDKFSEAEASWWLKEIYEKIGDKESAEKYGARCKKAGGYKKPPFLKTFGKLELKP